jgi:hypothetical protein
MPESFSHLFEFADKLGTVATAIFVVIAFSKGWWVPQWAYLELKERCEKITAISESLADLAEKNTHANEEIRRRNLELEREVLHLREAMRQR